MLRKNLFLRNYLGAAIIMLSVSAVSCHNNDTTSSTDTAISTDTSMMKVDNTGIDTSNKMPSAIATDTAATMGTSKMADSKMSDSKMSDPKMSGTGMAKPNPAKKGMKGKAVITAPMKGTGAMEMDNAGVYNNVEFIPSFPGGNKGLQKYFDDNLKYPEDASNDGVEGTVKVSFVVDENGKLSSPQVMGDKMGYGLEDEALRVVNKMPTWNPGKLKGKNVKTRYTLPINFQLY
ncbi:MAG: energy transducer TonB [Ferruginibacter sp.]